MKTELLATELRKRLWDNPDVLDGLLQRVPDDEIILAFTPSPDCNESLRMSKELIHTLAAKAANIDQFFALCTEAAREVDAEWTRRHAEQHLTDTTAKNNLHDRG